MCLYSQCCVSVSPWLLLLALVQDEGSGVVISGHGHHRVPLERSGSRLVHGVSGDGGGGVAGPVQSVPGPVVRQAFH